MPPTAPSSQKNTLFSYFAKTPSQSRQNAAFASSPAPPSTVQETPNSNSPTASSHVALSPLSSPMRSRSPSPLPPQDIAPYDGVAENRTSSLPQSSGTSTNTSKRTFSGGIPVVLNSDSDSDSLTDLDELWGEPAKPKPTTRAATVARGKEGFKSHALPQPPKISKDDRAFKRLVQTARKNAELEREIAQAQAELEKDLRADLPQRDSKFNEAMVADVVRDGKDSEKAKKLYLAMQRTNAFQVDHVFHFFDRQLSGTTAVENPFPTGLLSKHQFAPTFQDTFSREQTFLSGFARLLFKRELPEELAEWMIDEVCIGTNEALSLKYLEILNVHQLTLQKLLHVDKLEQMFKHVGAMEQYNIGMEVKPSDAFDPGKTRILPKMLINVCKLLQLPNSLLQSEARIKILRFLFLACMDDGVHADNDVLRALQDTIESLICFIPSNGSLASILDNVLADLLLRVKHPILQQNLVSALPIRSPLTASLQRYLALSFLLQPIKISHPLGSPENLDLLHSHLQSSPNFRINKDTDYRVLAASFSLLDIAVGPGPLHVPYQPLISPPTSQDPQGLALITALAPSKEDVKAFNREVDALAKRIRLIGNGIHVAGAITDLSRLAASDACDRLCTRLEHVVRIGGRKLKNIFGAGVEESEGSKATFRKWLEKKNEEPNSGGVLAVKNTVDDAAATNDGSEVAGAEITPDLDVDIAEENMHSGAAMTGVEMTVKPEQDI